ncbi:hypothetical protein PFISCL1PPCAC_7543, partial [Pristionchus fissidentatus]
KGKEFINKYQHYVQQGTINNNEENRRLLADSTRLGAVCAHALVCALICVLISLADVVVGGVGARRTGELTPATAHSAQVKRRRRQLLAHGGRAEISALRIDTSSWCCCSCNSCSTCSKCFLADALSVHHGGCTSCSNDKSGDEQSARHGL